MSRAKMSPELQASAVGRASQRQYLKRLHTEQVVMVAQELIAQAFPDGGDVCDGVRWDTLLALRLAVRRLEVGVATEVATAYDDQTYADAVRRLGNLMAILPKNKGDCGR